MDSGTAAQGGIPGLLVRQERPEDYSQTEALVREAFWNRYAPGCSEHYLLRLLRQSMDFEPWHSLVAEYEGKLIGQVMLSPGKVVSGEGAAYPVLTLGPVCVLPAVFLRGVGSALMRAAISAAREHGAAAILLMGDPNYYSRFGFLPASRFGIRLPGMEVNEEAAFFMALPLHEGALEGVQGLFHEAPEFAQCDGEGLEAYDSAFPERVKMKLPGQLR